MIMLLHWLCVGAIIVSIGLCIWGWREYRANADSSRYKLLRNLIWYSEKYNLSGISTTIRHCSTDNPYDRAFDYYVFLKFSQRFDDSYNTLFNTKNIFFSSKLPVVRNGLGFECYNVNEFVVELNKRLDRIRRDQHFIEAMIKLNKSFEYRV